MPSWNIHIAQTERLLAMDGEVARTVRDRNAFLFGNMLPDIPVGYMVPGIDDPIPYRITHCALPEPIPKPRERDFWDTYVTPMLPGADASAPEVPLLSIVDEREVVNRVHYPRRYEGADPLPEPHPDIVRAREAVDEASIRRSLFDLTLGAWAHLLADNLWNTRVNQFLDELGTRPNDEFRIKKQGDFDWFGHSLRIEAIPYANERLLLAAEAFPQYPIDRACALQTVGVAHEIVRSNGMFSEHPPYRLLTQDFFDRTLEEVVETTEAALRERL